jgi:phosphoglycolate phosphatase-like HAD superfamily hydrolase
MQIEKLILFDIDGTLLWSDGAGRAAIRQALLDEMGTSGPIDEYSFAGKTDKQIVHELMLEAGHPHAKSDEHVKRVCNRYAELLGKELEAPGRNLHVYVGVKDLLSRLGTRHDSVVGLLTGNLAAGAALKLAAVGIDIDQFRVVAYGSDAVHRAALPAMAAERAEPIMGRVPQGDEVVIIGDTPADVECGRGIGARAIAVATGPYDADALRVAGAYAVFQDFSDPDSVIEAIYA